MSNIPNDNPAGAREGDARIEQIREILVGGHMRALTECLDRLAEQMSRETQHILDETKWRQASLQELTEGQLTLVTEEYRACRETLCTLEESLRRFHADFGARISAVERRLEELELIEQAPISADARERMIRDTAYFLGLQRGHANKDPAQDWAEAEKRVEQDIAEMSGVKRWQSRVNKPRP